MTGPQRGGPLGPVGACHLVIVPLDLWGLSLVSTQYTFYFLLQKLLLLHSMLT